MMLQINYIKWNNLCLNYTIVILFMCFLFSCSTNSGNNMGDLDSIENDELDSIEKENETQEDGDNLIEGDNEENTTDGDADPDINEEDFDLDYDFGDYVVPPVLPRPKLTVNESDPFNPDFPCNADKYYPGNSTKDGALEVFPGDCITNMTLCDFNRKDWYYINLDPGNTLAIWGLPSYPGGIWGSAKSYQQTPTVIFFDKPPSSPFFFTSGLPDIYYNYSYTFCLNQGPVVEAWDKLPTPHVLPANHLTFALPKKTENLDLLPTCFGKNRPYNYDSPPYLAIVQLDYTDKSLDHQLYLYSYEYGALELLSSCKPDAQRLSCVDGVYEVSQIISAQEVKPRCVLVGIATFNESLPRFYLTLKEEDKNE